MPAAVLDEGGQEAARSPRPVLLSVLCATLFPMCWQIGLAHSPCGLWVVKKMPSNHPHDALVIHQPFLPKEQRTRFPRAWEGSTAFVIFSFILRMTF